MRIVRIYNSRMFLQIDQVDVRYAGQERPAVHGATLGLRAGEIGVLIGPSGCGKTTLLRAVAGLERVASGQIRLDGQVVSSTHVHVAPEARRIGMVFQDYALFPHLSVADNIGFGLRAEASTTRDARVAELLQLVGLAGQGNKYPHEMSGGQQQRVALARALAPRPSLLLLDEPFSNLDVELRERLSYEVRDIIKVAKTTAILVTHDQNEAFAVADEIGIMHEGRIQQWDTPYQLYHKPANRFVADFIGQGVFIEGRMLDERHVQIELGVLDNSAPLLCGEDSRSCRLDLAVDVLLRPDDVVHDDSSALKAEVVHKAFRGANILYTLRLGSGVKVLSLVPSHHNHALGERIGIRLAADHVITFQDQPADKTIAATLT